MAQAAVHVPQEQLRLWAVAVLVAVFHLLSGWVLMRNDLSRVSHSTLEPLELLSFLSIDSKPVRLAIDMPAPIQTRIQVSMPIAVIVGQPLPPPNFMAITVPGTDQVRPIHLPVAVLLEKTEWDSGVLSQSCARAFPQAAHYLVGEGSAALQVFVEEDGRISQTRLVQSSGDESRDQTISACVLLYGEYEPVRAAGVATATWQRVNWIHGTLGAIGR